ncbi:MAG TPA: proline/glycine betaine ABC transporter permease [Dehalococcoidia bacterium]|nr:proline/glycine betaine ABC transporter permease [Dehalococcoidia bacterium]
MAAINTNRGPTLAGNREVGDRPSGASQSRSWSKPLTGVAGVLASILLAAISLAFWDPDGIGRRGMEFPAEVGEPIANTVKDGTRWLIREWGGMFDGVDYAITITAVWLEDTLLWIPWPSLVLLVGLVSWLVAGWKISLFSVSSLLLIGFLGRWESSIETLALIVLAVSLSIAIALPLGVLGARNNRVDAVMRPILDGMQTMPSYVYLVPGILFFGLGHTPAVIATVVYAVPPAIRLTNLGIRQVSPETVEAARSFGATSAQLLFKVQVPMALPTIMAGINQTTMLALSMVVIASLVGASGLGEDVFRALQRQDPGNSAIAGFSIVLIAIIIDRITQSAAGRRQNSVGGA